jgi:cold shock CspA family protein
MIGTVRNINQDKSFGFITGQGGGDFFFHRSAVNPPDAFSDMQVGQKVEFEPTMKGPKGPRAENVRVL